MAWLMTVIGGSLLLVCGQTAENRPVATVAKVFETVEQELHAAGLPSAEAEREARAKVRAAQRDLLAVATLQRDAQQGRASFHLPRGVSPQAVCDWVLPNWARMLGYYVGGFKLEQAAPTEPRFDLGVALSDSGERPGRVLVTSDAIPGFPADGVLQRGDEITAIDGEPLPDRGSAAALLMRLQEAQPGDSFTLSAVCGGLQEDVTITLSNYQRCTVIVPALSPRGGKAVRIRAQLAHEGGRWRVCGMEVVGVPRFQADPNRLPITPKAAIKVPVPAGQKTE